MAGILFYAPTLFISYFGDETAFIQRNEFNSAKDIFSTFAKKDFDRDYYRPVGNFFSGVITFIGGYNSAIQRLFNIILHILNSFMVFQLAKKVVNEHKDKIAIASAFLFLVYPLLDLSVLWITDMFDRTMLLFYLIALLFYLEDRPGYAIVAFLLSLFSKEMALSFPLIVFVTSIFIKKKKIKTALIEILPYVLLIVIYTIFRLYVLDNNFITSDKTHPFIGITGLVKNYILFGGLLIFPFFSYDFTPFIKDNLNYFIIGGAILVIPAILILRKLKADWRILIFLLLFILLTILPASRLVMKWYLYLPSVGFIILVSYIIFTNFKIKRGVFFASAIFCIFLVSNIIVQFKWLDLTTTSDKIISRFKEEYKQEIATGNTLVFLTIPAKIGNYPVNHLNFGDHIKYHLKCLNKIEIVSRSSLENWNNKINFSIKDSTITIEQDSVNHFILYGYENFYDFSDTDLRNGKIIRIHHKVENENNIFFKYSNGKFSKYEVQIN